MSSFPHKPDTSRQPPADMDRRRAQTLGAILLALIVLAYAGVRILMNLR
jgi:hypothetical protein